jgi:hypothetical protein
MAWMDAFCELWLSGRDEKPWAKWVAAGQVAGQVAVRGQGAVQCRWRGRCGMARI